MSCITVWRKGNCATKSGEKENKKIISQSVEKGNYITKYGEKELYHKYGEKELYHKVWRN